MQSKSDKKEILQTLSAAQRRALSGILSEDDAKDARKELEVGTTRFESFVLRVSEGFVEVAPNGERAPTSMLLTTEFLALCFQRLGATRPAILKAIKEAATQHIEALKAAKAGTLPVAESTEQTLALKEGSQYLEALVKTLPKTPCGGKSTATFDIAVLHETKGGHVIHGREGAATSKVGKAG